ncbi:hypothetical protein BG004_004424 [Podila humilis]|nr:hypothetical protein BG004_004424 [Podila humilis]
MDPPTTPGNEKPIHKSRAKTRAERKTAKDTSGDLNNAAMYIDAQFDDILSVSSDTSKTAPVAASASNASKSSKQEKKPGVPNFRYRTPRHDTSSKVQVSLADVPQSLLNPSEQPPTSSTQEPQPRTVPPPLTMPTDEDEWEWVEETQFVVLDFGATKFTVESIAGQNFSVANLDSTSPFFRSGPHVFKGFYDENAITEDIIFDMKAYNAEPEEGVEDSDDESPGTLDLVSIVTKRVIFEPVELLPAPEQASVSQSENDVLKGPSYTMTKAVRLSSDTRQSKVQEAVESASSLPEDTPMMDTAEDTATTADANANVEHEDGAIVEQEHDTEIEREDDAMGV